MSYVEKVIVGFCMVLGGLALIAWLALTVLPIIWAALYLSVRALILVAIFGAFCGAVYTLFKIHFRR